jgi:hypothetical protein
VCAIGTSARIVDSLERPDCKQPSGLPLGSQPTLIRQRTTKTSAGYRVSLKPVQLTATIVGQRIRVSKVAPSISRAQRRAESLSTIEVAAFDTGSLGRAPRTRAEVFEQLPEFAAAAPNAVVRTARALGRDGSFWYGAQIRDPQLSGSELEALRGTAARLSIPIVVKRTPMETLPTTCAGIAAAADVFTVQMNANDLRGAPDSSPTLCDEPSQVQIVSAPIVSVNTFADSADTVVDASVRVLPT